MKNVSPTQVLEALPVVEILWIVFGITVIVFIIYSALLLWHWKLYSTGKFTTLSNALLYLCVSSGFIFVMAFSAVWYSLVV